MKTGGYRCDASVKPRISRDTNKKVTDLQQSASRDPTIVFVFFCCYYFLFSKYANDSLRLKKNFEFPLKKLSRKEIVAKEKR